MAEQNIHTDYSVADIERYLNGQMNAKEMHDMERAALQDPFLSDAIEGYKTASFTTSYKHLNEIEALIAGQKQQALVIAMPAKKSNSWKIAAAAVVIFGAGITAWLTMNNSRQNAAVPAKDMAMVSPTHVDTIKATTPPSLKSAQAEIRPAGGSATKAIVKNKIAEVQKNYASGLTPGYTKESSDTGDFDTDKKLVAGNIQSAPSRKFFLKTDSLKATDNALANNNSVANNPYSNVASPKGPLTQNTQPVNKQAVPGAKDDISARVDTSHLEEKQGFAGLYKSKERASNQAYKKPATAMQNSAVTNLKVTLVPLPSFDSVPVTYLNNKNFRSKMVSDSTLFPQGGWESFRDYVYRKLHKDIDTTDDGMAFGDVEIEFTVDNLGNARNLKVTKSLDKQSDAQAIELVRQWPGWIAGKKHKKGKVVIQF